MGGVQPLPGLRPFFPSQLAAGSLGDLFSRTLVASPPQALLFHFVVF